MPTLLEREINKSHIVVTKERRTTEHNKLGLLNGYAYLIQNTSNNPAMGVEILTPYVIEGGFITNFYPVAIAQSIDTVSRLFDNDTTLTQYRIYLNKMTPGERLRLYVTSVNELYFEWFNKVSGGIRVKSDNGIVKYEGWQVDN